MQQMECIIMQWYSCMFCRFGGTSINFPIVLDDVDCSNSTYLTILQCEYSTLIDSNCDRELDDVTVFSACKYIAIKCNFFSIQSLYREL